MSQVKYRHMACPVCGVRYAVDETFMHARDIAERGDKEDTWYCPAGHSLVYRPNKLERERKRRRAAEETTERLSDQLKNAREDLKYERRSRAAFMGQNTKLRKELAECQADQECKDADSD